ncbi:UNVERIFIED_ORG: hypothetical protein J2811_005949 [Burkholderia cepacia]|jgi:hypothetical protein|nr:hypothetical protein [Burkholderia cepacia]PZW94274.1 hypothetical protein DFS13_120133 [Burkholderia sp. 28_3]RAS42543.1 hypothetical protein DFS07_12218 [Burkholderia cenocepacia]MDP9598528.1 hypothetical protein [Burkholderia cepacia]MDP9626474.1 hypothetical protein [Burkholderia cepacia]
MEKLLIGVFALAVVLGIAILRGVKRMNDDEHHRH